MYRNGRAWIEVDLSHLEHNVNELKRTIPKDGELMPVVKANAYGHGAVEIIRKLSSMGISNYCVACLSEGIELRQAGIAGDILILGYTAPEEFELLGHYNLTQTIVDAEYGQMLARSGIKLKTQLAVDTGMHRLGISYDDNKGILSAFQYGNLTVCGIYSHLCAADSNAGEYRAFTLLQINRFNMVLQWIKEAGCSGIKAHLQSSYGMLNYPGQPYPFARPGIALYGVLSSSEDTYGADVRLEPVLSLKSRIESMRQLEKGELAGYGLAYTADRRMRLAAVSIGYADGIPRNLSCGEGKVLLGGKKVPIIGRICMDQLMIDVTEVTSAKAGDEVILIGKSGDQEITAADMAGWAGTISNEILSCLGKRLERIYIESSLNE